MLRVLLKGTREKVPGFAEQLLLEMFGDYISIGKEGPKKKKTNPVPTSQRRSLWRFFSPPFQWSSDNTVIVDIRVVNSL